MLSTLSLECTSEATLHCGSAPLNAPPAGSLATCWCLLWQNKLCQTNGKLCRDFVQARQHLQTVSDMSPNITVGRQRCSSWEKAELCKVRITFRNCCGSGGRACGPLIKALAGLYLHLCAWWSVLEQDTEPCMAALSHSVIVTGRTRGKALYTCVSSGRKYKVSAVHL